MRVLMVDDEPDVELLIRQKFKRRVHEFEFRFARNGQEALQQLQEDPGIDVVITDINMPVMDGLTLLSKLNGDNARTLKAVILSAYGDMPNIRTAMNRGAFDFLLKPIDFQDFETTIRKTHNAVAAARQGLEARAQLVALQQELRIASGIQQSILPQFPLFTGRSEFAIYGRMAPAHMVGGDFYDCFLIDEGRLGFVIGDVSGKGIPAALFMAVSRTLLSATALQCLSPSECCAYMNQVLCRQGGDAMFVTAFYGILHTGTGELEFCRAGHNPPILISHGELRTMAEPGSLILGAIPEATYQTGRIRLEPEDTLFLYTDGVTEATDAEGAFFSEKRLRAQLEALAGATPQELTERVLAAVQDFSGGAPQADDITLLAVRYLG